MKPLLIAIAIALPISLSAPLASASPGARSLSKKETACAKAKRQGKACQITFGVGDDVEGSVVAPDGDDVIGRMEALFGGLLELRYDFRAEIIAAADDL